MADSRQITTASTIVRLLLASLGTTALAVAVFAISALLSERTSLPKTLNSWLESPFGLTAIIAAIAAVACFGLIAIMGIGSMSGRRSATGLMSVSSVLLATVSLFAVNWFSFHQSRSIDMTRDKRFTLPESAVAKLKTLDPNSKTTVVLLQLHKSAGSLSNKADSLDYAAERKVIEKVQDMIEMFRRFGPQFTIVALDTEDEEYGSKLENLTKGKPELLSAIENAPENSILFADERGKVRRLGFNEFYRLDKDASWKETEVDTEDGKKKVRQIHNLVLLPQGIDGLMKRAVEDSKKPKVGLLTIHPELSSRESRDDYCAKGLRECLEANGIEVLDVFLKDWTGRTGPKPASYTYEEFELKKNEERYNLYSTILQDRELSLKQLAMVRDRAKKATVEELNKMIRLPNGQKFTTEQDKASLLKGIDESEELTKQEIVELNAEIAKLGPKYKEMLKDEKAVEARRISDVKQKMAQIIADCDLLIVPRYTVMDIAKGEVIRPSLYAANKDQAEVIKGFMKAGKPVMALFGANNVGGGGGLDGGDMPDDVERMFMQFGIEFGGQTLIYDDEAIAAAERSGGGLSSAAKLPSLVFKSLNDAKTMNPVTKSFVVNGRGAGGKFELNRSGFRPITLTDSLLKQLDYDPHIAITTSTAWNEEKPIPEEDYIPKFEPTKPDDPKKKTKDEERRGPFPVGVAFESKLPLAWYTNQPVITNNKEAHAALFGTAFKGFESILDDSTTRPSVRVVALGHGGLFVGKSIDPATQTLLLTALNWQLRQDDHIAKDVPEKERWSFPRSTLSAASLRFWQTFGLIDIPMIVACLGIFVLLFRRLR